MIRKNFQFWCLLLAVALCSIIQVAWARYRPSAQADALVLEAQQAADRKDWQQVLSLAQKTLQVDPHFVRARSYMAVAYIGMKKPCLAIEQCQKVLAHDIKKYNYQGYAADRTWAADQLKTLKCLPVSPTEGKPPAPPKPIPKPTPEPVSTSIPPPVCDLQLPPPILKVTNFDYGLIGARESASAHENEISTMAWSPDGATLATAGVVRNGDKTASEIALWDVANVGANAQPIKRLLSRWAAPYNGAGTPPAWIGQWTNINALVWSPDGKWLASAGEDGRVAVWDVPCGDRAYALEKAASKAMALAWTDEGLKLITSGGDMLFYKTRGTELVGYLTLKPVTDKLTAPESGDWVRVAAFSSDGKSYAASSIQGRIVLWSYSAKNAARTIFNSREQDLNRPEGIETTALAFSPDGKWLASANHAHIYLNSATDGVPFRTWTARIANVKARVGALAWSPDNRWLLARVGEKILRLNPDTQTRSDVSFTSLPAPLMNSPELAVSPSVPVVADASGGKFILWKAQ